MSNNIYHPTVPITIQHNVYPQPITALSFDPVSDVLWAGNNTGFISAYYSSRMRGVVFPVGGDMPVKKITAGDQQIRAVGGSGHGMGSWSKGGVNKWYYRPSSIVTTFSHNPISSHSLVLATSTPELVTVNASTGTITRQSSVPSIIVHLHSSHSLTLSGCSDGYLRTHDLRTGTRRDGAAENVVKAHTGGIQALDSAGNFAYTIGWGLRQSRPFADPLVKLYDLRTLRALPPVPFPAGPGFIKVHPLKPTMIYVASNRGLVNMLDVSDQRTGEFHQLEVNSYITSFAVNSTASHLAFGDAEGIIHILSTESEGSHIPFNGFDGGQAVEWAEPPDPLPDIMWTDETPLNSIGMPYYSEMLLSSHVPAFSMPNSFPPPPKIPQQVLNTMKKTDFVGYAPLPKELKGKRNMVVTGNRGRGEGRFRSDKHKRQESLPETPLHEYSHSDVPRHYRKVEIEYSKFGVEDFDFGFYNKTPYSGLETHILNSYTNSLLQTLHYTLPIRRLAKSHITTPCQREHCLFCELGFVLRMLEDAQGTNCQAANFCKTVGDIPQATALGIIDYGREGTEVDYASMIQIFNRFLLEQLCSEGNAFPHNPHLLPPPPGLDPGPAAAPITQLLGIDAKSVIICGNCGARREKEGMTHLVDLIYPRKNLSNEAPPPSDFTTILRNSIIRDTTYKATCQTCKQLATFRSRRTVTSPELPPILAVNASVYNDEHHKYWLDEGKPGGFLPPQVAVKIASESNQPVTQLENESDGVMYELRSLIVHITGKDKTSHLVSIVKVPEHETEPGQGSPWFVFNDFSVRNITEQEALSFPGKWKVPTVLYFERVDCRGKLDFSKLPDELDPAILSRDTSMSPNRDPTLMKHESLRFEELPKPGTLVAVDAEFVELQQEETEFRSDGTKKVLRPPRLTLARVSVLRGDGPKQGIPFIDDYIHTSDVVVNYLTEYSGIRYGDLDPHLSKHTLVPLKVAYKKLRLLVDLGCIFIGHGLSKDFRIINIFVPPDQVIDTVDLYFIKERQRRLSLRFLSWFVLKEQIQQDTHDSIEDARSALLLYKAYHQFEEQGIFDQKLEEIYREGRQYGYKPPPPPGAQAPAATSAAPTSPQQSARLSPTRAFQPAGSSPLNLTQQQMTIGGGFGNFPNRPTSQTHHVFAPPMFPSQQWGSTPPPPR